jgi:hypothetical protein
MSEIGEICFELMRYDYCQEPDTELSAELGKQACSWCIAHAEKYNPEILVAIRQERAGILDAPVEL